jgi:hypothetical protein
MAFRICITEKESGLLAIMIGLSPFRARLDCGNKISKCQLSKLCEIKHIHNFSNRVFAPASGL